MLNRFSEGEYVYIPSSSHLFQFGEGGNVNRAHILESPAYVVLLNSSQPESGYYNVFYEGQLWSVAMDSVYSGEKCHE